MTYRTIQVATTAVPILIGNPLVSGALDTYTLANNDIVNPVWISNNRTVTPNASDAIQIPPLGSAPIPTNMDTYAVSQVGAGVQLFLIPGNGGWSPSPSQVAQQINTLGLAKDTTVTGVNTSLVDGSQLTSVIANPVDLWDFTGTTVGPTGTAIPAPVNPSPVAGYANVNELSYDISGSQRITAGAATPFIKWELFFFDDDSLTAPVVDYMAWYIAAGNGGNDLKFMGHGPLRGVYCQLRMTNLDNVQTATITAKIRGTARAYSRDDWRTPLGMPAINGFTLSGGNFGALVVAEINGVVLGAGTNASRILPLYAGKVRIRYTSGSTGSIQFKGINTQSVNMINQTQTDNSEHLLELSLPRDHCLVTINAGASGVTFFMTMIAEEY